MKLRRYGALYEERILPKPPKEARWFVVGAWTPFHNLSRSPATAGFTLSIGYMVTYPIPYLAISLSRDGMQPNLLAFTRLLH